MLSKRVTLADVARRAGLSMSAASMILNGRPDTRLSQDAHDRVHAAAAGLGYRPNVAARGLKTDKTHTIAFVSDLVATTRYASGLITGAIAAAEECCQRSRWQPEQPAPPFSARRAQRDRTAQSRRAPGLGG